MLINLHGIKKNFLLGGRSISVLKGIELTVGKNEFLAIMGPSGSGKSTLLNIIGLLDKPDRGSYFFNGKDVLGAGDSELSRLRGHHIGFVFQNFHLIPALNVFENVSLPLFYSQKDHSQKAEDAVNGVLQKVGLEHRRFHKPMELSGGEMQRTAIARAMVMEPEVILADEPTGNLDSKTGFEILAHFQKFHEGGGTVIMITHDLEIAKLAPKRLNLKDGIFVEPRISHPQTG